MSRFIIYKYKYIICVCIYVKYIQYTLPDVDSVYLLHLMYIHMHIRNIYANPPACRRAWLEGVPPPLPATPPLSLPPLIDRYSFGMLSMGCSGKHLLVRLLLIYGSVFVSSSSTTSSSLIFCFSLRLPPSVHIHLPLSTSTLSPPCSGLLSSPRLIYT